MEKETLKKLIGAVDEKEAKKEMEKARKEAVKRIKEGSNFILAVEGQAMCCGDMTDSIASLGILMRSFRDNAGEEIFNMALKVMNADSKEELNKVYEEIFNFDFGMKLKAMGIPVEAIEKAMSEVEDERETI